MSSFRAVVRQPAFFALLGGAFFVLLCLPFVIQDGPLDLYAPGLFRYLFGVWAAAVALLAVVAPQLGDEGPGAGREDGDGGA